MSINNNGSLKIAIASHGLSRVTRGSEMWAKTLSYALKNDGVDVRLYKGWGSPDSGIERTVSCIKRDSPIAHRVTKFLPSWRWRIGCNNTHTLEATSFALGLIKELNKDKIDIVHTADPQVARTLIAMRRWRFISASIIFSDAIPDESLDFVGDTGFIQHVAPYYLHRAVNDGKKVSNRFAIPNFVDINAFNPGIKTDIRKQLNIPEEAFVILSVANIDRTYKRVDYLIKEAAHFFNSGKENAYLILCGAEGGDSNELIQMALGSLGNRVRFLLNQPHKKMPEIYAAADVFTVCSVNEVFGIVFIEAMACGKPAIGHIYPPTMWVIDQGGSCVDMTQEGVLSSILARYTDKAYRKDKTIKAREEAVRRFSQEKVVGQIIDMYEKVSRQ